MLLWDINKLNTFLNATQVSSQSLHLQILEDLEVLKITNKSETQCHWKCCSILTTKISQTVLKEQGDNNSDSRKTSEISGTESGA